MQVIMLIIGVVALLYGCCFSDSAKKYADEREAQERADAKPHVIREADGCKVYAFKASDYWHYFTRCNDGTVTTERNWTENCGKGCTKHKSETIVTEGNK